MSINDDCPLVKRQLEKHFGLPDTANWGELRVRLAERLDLPQTTTLDELQKELAVHFLLLDGASWTEIGEACEE